MSYEKMFIESNLPEPLNSDDLYDCFVRMQCGSKDDRKKIILRKLYGIDNGVPNNQKKIADELGVSNTYVSVVLKKSLRFIKHQLINLNIIEKNIK